MRYVPIRTRWRRPLPGASAAGAGRSRLAPCPRKTLALGGVALAAGLLALSPERALAHSGPPPVPETIWRSWSLDPIVLLGLPLLAALYLRGVHSLWSRAGRGRGIA